MEVPRNKINGCCKPFSPFHFQDKEIIWLDKLFVKDTITSFFHVHLNKGNTIKRNLKKIEKIESEHSDILILIEEKSLFSSDIFFETSLPISGSNNVNLSGKFYTRVYEGPRRNILKWKENMKKKLAEKGIEIERFFYFTPTCPECAKKYGKNYVVMFAKEQ